MKNTRLKTKKESKKTTCFHLWLQHQPLGHKKAAPSTYSGGSLAKRRTFGLESTRSLRRGQGQEVFNENWQPSKASMQDCASFQIQKGGIHLGCCWQLHHWLQPHCCPHSHKALVHQAQFSWDNIKGGCNDWDGLTEAIRDWCWLKKDYTYRWYIYICCTWYMKTSSYICIEYDIWNMIYVIHIYIYIYGMVSDILWIYVWTLIYVIFLYGSILLILSMCKKLYIYIIYHRPVWLMQIILLLLDILPCQRIILNSMAQPIKKEPVLCHNIAKYAVVKSEEQIKASRH